MKTLYKEIRKVNKKKAPKKKKPLVDDTILYGVEIEFCRPPETGKKSAKPNEALQIDIEDVYPELDAGGRDGGGVEVITEPHNFKWWKENGLKLFQFLKIPRDHNYSSDNNVSGMHVHIDMEYMTYKHFLAFWSWVSNNKHFMLHVSRRTTRTQFIDPLTTAGKTHTPMNKIDETTFESYEKPVGNHCIVLNLQSDKRTLECRFFNGTLDPEVAIANIEFVRALYYFTKSKREQTCNEFMRYADEYEDKYPYLTKKFLVNYTAQ